jgi:heptosyltransferase-2
LKKILIIQTAFIGDVILATPLIEKLYDKFPNSKIDFVLRKGNEKLFVNHPKLNNVLIWNKKQNKYLNLIKILKQIRANNYDYVINLQRFATSGFLTFLSKGKTKIGFNKNPFSFSYKIKTSHIIGNGTHETERNLLLIESITDNSKYQPKLYPHISNFNKVKNYKTEKYICIAPASVWYTKQYPKHKWIELINAITNYKVYLIGAPSDYDLCNEIINKSIHKNAINLTKELSFLDSAALMKDADMNYVNDSAPMHIASSVNANVTAIFCSTIPDFGFGPLSSNSNIVEVNNNLKCRPCGLHGRKECPEKHFNCAEKIQLEQLTKVL